MTQCKGHHCYKTAEITLLCHKVLCFLYTVSITSFCYADSYVKYRPLIFMCPHMCLLAAVRLSTTF